MIGTMMVVSGLWNKPGVYTTDEFDPIRIWKHSTSGVFRGRS